MAHKGQLWRHLCAIATLGVSWTVASYRNDVGAPSTGMYELGAGEWADIEAVLDDAVARGARRIVLVGLSMGGAIVARLLTATTHGRRIAGVVLDAPVLDWASVLRHVTTGNRGVAILRPLVPAVLALAARRARLEPRALRLLVDADRLEVPLLLLHGSADRVVPVSTSDALAQARPDLVTYERFDGAGHVTAWNADPVRYDRALQGFVAAVR
jgi:pimeloyl-ACP methyl ester carboxylesterase